jgi:recombination protein RecA
MSAAHDVEALLQSLRRGTDARCRIDSSGDAARAAAILEISWPGLADLLPDGGVPRGVVELAAPRALGGSTSFALAAVRAGQARGEDTWCAWIDPEGTLHAPGVVAAGVDLSRMLVVRPPRRQLGRVAVKVMGAGAFEVVVIDFDAVPGASSPFSASMGWAAGAKGSPGRARDPRDPNESRESRKKSWAPEVLVRKLALSAESCGTTVLLLTDSTRPRATPWPVALRLELSRPNRDDLVVRVAKDRRGRIGMVKTVSFMPVTPLAPVTSVVPAAG